MNIYEGKLVCKKEDLGEVLYENGRYTLILKDTDRLEYFLERRFGFYVGGKWLSSSGFGVRIYSGAEIVDLKKQKGASAKRNLSDITGRVAGN